MGTYVENAAMQRIEKAGPYTISNICMPAKVIDLLYCLNKSSFRVIYTIKEFKDRHTELEQGPNLSGG